MAKENKNSSSCPQEREARPQYSSHFGGQEPIVWVVSGFRLRCPQISRSLQIKPRKLLWPLWCLAFLGSLRGTRPLGPFLRPRSSRAADVFFCVSASPRKLGKRIRGKNRSGQGLRGHGGAAELGARHHGELVLHRGEDPEGAGGSLSH